MIGIHDHDNPKAEAAREIYLEESRAIARVMTSVHHSRKQSHQQVYYPETTQRLGQLQANRSSSYATLAGSGAFDFTGTASSYSTLPSSSSSSSAIRPSDRAKSHAHEVKEMTLRAYQEKMTEAIKQEQFINSRKRNYNREVGRKAIVNKVIAGTAPLPKYTLFPQGASHEQILALTNTLKAPDANSLPPEVPRPRKWRGDNVGWDN
eukprot:scaffold1524_cov182-Ochromonas_danica.AAC.3